MSDSHAVVLPTDAPIGGIASTAAPLQTDITFALTAVAILALTGFMLFMLYLAFGPHGRVLREDERGAGQARSTVEGTDPDGAAVATDASDAAAGGDVGTETEGSSKPDSGTGSGSPESG